MLERLREVRAWYELESTFWQRLPRMSLPPKQIATSPHCGRRAGRGGAVAGAVGEARAPGRRVRYSRRTGPARQVSQPSLPRGYLGSMPRFRLPTPTPPPTPPLTP
jgi:hypothetical protein